MTRPPTQTATHAQARLFCCTALAVAAVPAAHAQSFSIQWQAIAPGNTSHGGTFSMTSAVGQSVAATITSASFSISSGYLVGGGGVGCDAIDFNQDGLYPDTADIDDFLSVFSGGPCSTGTCSDIDFNNDSLFPDTADIDALLSVFSGGPCQ